MAITNRAAYLLGASKRATTRPFGRLRDGRQKAAIKVSVKTALGSRLISKVKEGQGCMVQTWAVTRQRSRTSLGGVRPSLETLYTRTSRPLHSPWTRANMFTTRPPVLANTALQLDIQPASPEVPIKIEPQDEDSILIAWHQEGIQDENEQPEHEQPPPQPQPQPEPRRSARIKAMQDAVPPKVKTPAKSTGRKRAVRKK